MDLGLAAERDAQAVGGDRAAMATSTATAAAVEHPVSSRVGERGFTVVEVLIAMVVLLIGMAGILSLQLTAMQATSFSRHATEASTLAEDKMEDLRTVPITSLAAGTDTVDARGVPDTDGLFTRSWTVTAGTETTTVTVAVSWLEKGGDPYSIKMSTLRTNAP